MFVFRIKDKMNWKDRKWKNNKSASFWQDSLFLCWSKVSLKSVFVLSAECLRQLCVPACIRRAEASHESVCTEHCRHSVWGLNLRLMFVCLWSHILLSRLKIYSVFSEVDPGNWNKSYFVTSAAFMSDGSYQLLSCKQGSRKHWKFRFFCKLQCIRPPCLDNHKHTTRFFCKWTLGIFYS